jgi:hypothetical protein
VYLGVAFALFTWLPLLALAAVGNTLASGSAIPFAQSMGTHVRLLVAVPLFFLAEASFDFRVREAIRTLVASQLVAASQLPQLSTALFQARRWRDSWLLEAILVVISIFFIRGGVRTDLPEGVSTWRETTTGQPSLAGWWYILVSLPVYQFLIWRWCARLLIWWHLLWRIRALNLQLLPIHPDLAGGLGALGVAHVALAPLNLAVSGVLVASFSEQPMFAGADLRRVVVAARGNGRWRYAGSRGAAVVLHPGLIDAKQRGSLEYGCLAASYTRAFEAKWLRSNGLTEPLLGTPEVQSLADLANAFGVIRQMRIISITRSQILLLAGAAVVPALPLIFFIIPLDELIIRGVRTLLHL